MSVIKCKMCGGDLELIEGSSVAVCEYCGSQQTVPAADNEKKLTLFARANRLRLACEFDKAAGVYESIVADFPTEAEAYCISAGMQQRHPLSERNADAGTGQDRRGIPSSGRIVC